MGTKLSPPVAVCTVCRAYNRNPSVINERCGNVYNRKRCKGVWRSAISEGDWEECPVCKASGSEEDCKCGQCEGFGWIYCRR